MSGPTDPERRFHVSMPFYVAPEQQMKDRADFARKGIARGRSVIVLHYADGILFVAENRSQALHKVSEIYDRIGFAAVGRYNEFEKLRTAGIRYADLRGYSYDRTDVTGRGLANAYAQLLGTIFSSGGEKPYEVEIVVAELGVSRRAGPDLPADLRRLGRRRGQLRRDGRLRRRDRRGGRPGLPARARPGRRDQAGGPRARLRRRHRRRPPGAGVEALEVAILDRTRALPRKFRRVTGDRLAGAAQAEAEPAEPGSEPPATSVTTSATRMVTQARAPVRTSPAPRLP